MRAKSRSLAALGMTAAARGLTAAARGLTAGVVLLFGVAWANARAQTDSAARPRPFIGRILGVFDITSGQPIEGVEVLDMLSKTSALTTATGTVALSYVDSSGSVLRVRKVGYEPLMLTVVNYEGLSPITVTLTRTGVVLAPVVTTAARKRGAADTVRKLELNGFYDRRDRSGASPIAFVLGERIRSMQTFDDFRSLTGRPICTSNLWVDGVRVIEMPDTLTIGNRRLVKRNLRKNSADQILDATEVAAIENYRASEVPAEYNSTKPAGASSDCGATLIWTR